jgi:DNA polymerase-3 subunit gamma/tau
LEISVIKLSSRDSSSSLEARLSELEFKLDNMLNDSNKSSLKKELDLKKPEAAASNNQDKKSKSKVETAEKKESKNEKDEHKKNIIAKDTVKDTANSSNLSLKDVKENWAKILNEIRQLDVSVQALLREGAPTAVENKTVIVSFPESKKFHYKGAATNKALISGVLRNVLNEAVELEFQLGAKKKELNDKTNEKPNNKLNDKLNNNQKNRADDAHPAKNDLDTKTPASQFENNNNELAGDLDIDNVARIFSGEIIEVDQSILENRGGN